MKILIRKVFLVIVIISLWLTACGRVKGPSDIIWNATEEQGELKNVDRGEFNNVTEEKSVHEMSHEEFIDFVGKMACDSMKKTGVPVSVTIAQAILETGWGKSTIQDAKNLFGVKGVGPAGSIKAETKECDASGCYTTTASFRKYHNFQESIDDHAKIFSLPYYKEAMKYTKDPNEFANRLSGIYATDLEYGAKLISIMKANNLYKYDEACSR